MTVDSSTTVPTQDERVLATLAHIGVLIPTFGLIIPVLIWVNQKEKSRYVYFQSMQAIVYQLVMIFGWFLTMACYAMSIFGNILFIPLANTEVDSVFAAGMFIPVAVLCIMVLGWIGFTIYGCVAALLAFQGREFRYLIIGNQLEDFLKPK